MTMLLNGARKIPASDGCAFASLRGGSSHETPHGLSQFIHIPDLSYGHPVRGSLIHGDNIPVLHALRETLEGRVRCVYIDPPYNNREKYRHYVDNQRHGLWIEELSAQLAALRPLLAMNGSLWISIDDTELHYLKVAADSIMGRKNFVTTIVWQHRKTRENRKVFSNNHEYLLLYARDTKAFRASRNLLLPQMTSSVAIVIRITIQGALGNPFPPTCRMAMRRQHCTIVLSHRTGRTTIHRRVDVGSTPRAE